MNTEHIRIRLNWINICISSVSCDPESNIRYLYIRHDVQVHLCQYTNIYIYVVYIVLYLLSIGNVASCMNRSPTIHCLAVGCGGAHDAHVDSCRITALLTQLHL